MRSVAMIQGHLGFASSDASPEITCRALPELQETPRGSTPIEYASSPLSNNRAGQPRGEAVNVVRSSGTANGSAEVIAGLQDEDRLSSPEHCIAQKQQEVVKTRQDTTSDLADDTEKDSTRDSAQDPTQEDPVKNCIENPNKDSEASNVSGDPARRSSLSHMRVTLFDGTAVPKREGGSIETPTPRRQGGLSVATDADAMALQRSPSRRTWEFCSPTCMSEMLDVKANFFCSNCSQVLQEVSEMSRRKSEALIDHAKALRKPSLLPPPTPRSISEPLQTPRSIPEHVGSANSGSFRRLKEDGEKMFPFGDLWEVKPINMMDITEDGMPPDQRATTNMHKEFAVTIRAVSHLPQADVFGKCDPFVTMSFFEQEFCTDAKHNVYDASFDETFIVFVHGEGSSGFRV